MNDEVNQHGAFSSQTPKPKPEGWTSINLGDIFNKEQLQHILDVCEAAKDVSDAAAKLRPYFRGMSAHMEAKGLLADYASYAIPFHVMQAQGRAV